MAVMILGQRFAVCARLPSAALLLMLAAVFLGCADGAKLSEQKARAMTADLVPVIREDVAQVRRGLPEGSAKLAALLDPDPGANLAGLQRAIQGARSSVKDLAFAKSTFFAFADGTGVVLRSEADPDMLVGKSVFAAFPALSKALSPSGGIVEAFGEMAEMRGVRTGNDHAWVVAHRVVDAGGAPKGVFVTGWSFRRYAYYLEEAAKRRLIEEAQQDTKKRVPLVYVFIIKGTKAYGAPVTPDVSTDAVANLDILSKTAAAPFSGNVEITGRRFGVAGERTPDLAADAAIAVLTSEL